MDPLIPIAAYLLISIIFVAIFFGTRWWYWRKMRIGQHGEIFGSKYQVDMLEVMQRQTKALERIADTLDANRSSS